LTKAGVNRGLSEEIAATIARETVLGTAWMAATTGEDMASIAKRVASPKGTTEAGLAVLDGEAALDDLVAATINAAFVRGLELADEAKLAALGSVAAAGSAYVARFIAALAKAGVRRGLSDDIASTIARETVLGTSWMAATTGEEMESIARRVASPRGTTEAGLAVLDREDLLDNLIAATINAAFARGRELAEEARQLAD